MPPTVLTSVAVGVVVAEAVVIIALAAAVQVVVVLCYQRKLNALRNARNSVESTTGSELKPLPLVMAPQPQVAAVSSPMDDHEYELVAMSRAESQVPTAGNVSYGISNVNVETRRP